jgi:hypothetical protein
MTDRIEEIEKSWRRSQSIPPEDADFVLEVAGAGRDLRNEYTMRAITPEANAEAAFDRLHEAPESQ